MNTSKISTISAWAMLGLIIVLSFWLSYSASQNESAIMDELAHIPAGYGYVRYLDFRLNPEHPPLIKVIAAFPLLFGDFTIRPFDTTQDKQTQAFSSLGTESSGRTSEAQTRGGDGESNRTINFPTQSSAWQKEINGQWEVGNLFLYESGNDADKIIQWSRIGPLLITLLFIFFVYFWAKELIGKWWALLPTFLFGLSPTVLAHGHFVTTDVAAAFGTFIAIYYFVKYLISPSRKHLFWSGLAFGIAQLMKFSTVLLIPLFIFLIFVFYLWKAGNKYGNESLWKKTSGFMKLLFKGIMELAAIFVIGYLLVYVVYFVFTINYPVEKQFSDTSFILTSFAGGPDLKQETCNLAAKVPLSRRIRCLAEINILMTQNPITKPFAQYMLGVMMVLQRSSGGNTGYFLGEVSAAGWWYYFPVVFGLKEPVPSLILIAIGLALGLISIFKKIRSRGLKLITPLFDYIGTNFAEFSMISFVVLYWVYSIKSPLNIGVRHILPTVPFIYILATGAIKKWLGERHFIMGLNFWQILKSAGLNFIKFSFKGILVILLLAWYLTETIFTYPHFLPYFNEFAGGTDNGFRYVTDSNYDWGQDLKRLAEWVDKNLPAGRQVGIDYFGGGNPKYYLGNKAEYWWSNRGNPKKAGIDWLAISINSIQAAKGKIYPGFVRQPEDEYSWLNNPYEPYAKAGKSIFIYKL